MLYVSEYLNQSKRTQITSHFSSANHGVAKIDCTEATSDNSGEVVVDGVIQGDFSQNINIESRLTSDFEQCTDPVIRISDIPTKFGIIFSSVFYSLVLIFK